MPKNHVVRPKRSLNSSEARTQLPALVNELVAVKKAGGTLVEHAVEVGPRNRGGVLLVPAVDVDAAMDREEELRERVEALEDEVENMAIGFMLADRLKSSTGATVSGEDFIRSLGFDDVADELPH